MLGFVSTESNTCNGPSRREFLRLGGLAASGVTLSNRFAQQAQPLCANMNKTSAS